jgi:hypothetical protein
MIIFCNDNFLQRSQTQENKTKRMKSGINNGNGEILENDFVQDETKVLII